MFVAGLTALLLDNTIPGTTDSTRRLVHVLHNLKTSNLQKHLFCLRSLVNRGNGSAYSPVFYEFVHNVGIPCMVASISNIRVQAHILHTGATVHLWRATVHP